MKNRLQVAMVLFSVASVQPTLALGPTGSAANDHFYYDIGGATSITAPAYVNTQPSVLNGSIDLGLGYSCGKFDPIAGLQNTVNQVSQITNALAGAVQGAISALPLLIVQRVSPGLYDLLQNLIIKGEAVLALANSSCELMEQEIKKGNNPYEAWTDLSKMLDWKLEMKTGRSDVVLAKKNVETNNGKNGLPWIGGLRAGGNNQSQIRITQDVVKAGYNFNLNRSVTSNAAYAHSGSDASLPRLAEIWPSPGDAANWGVEVLGDVMISTYDNHTDQSIPGRGLLPAIEHDKERITSKLNDLVSGSATPDLSHLQAVSSHDLLLTQSIIKAIRDLPTTEQAIVMNKLASEVAMSLNLEKAIYLRRLLLSGKREPNVVKTAAITHIEEAIRELDRTVDDILFEKRIHHELVSSTATMLLALSKQHQNRGGVQQQEPGQDVNRIEDGATK
jgi:integrating conjugative element protein (TIGR03755 family)